MTLKTFLKRYVIVPLLIFSLLFTVSAPAYAGLNTSSNSQSSQTQKAKQCKKLKKKNKKKWKKKCDRQALNDNTLSHREILELQPYDAIDPDIFVDMEGASSNPADIQQLVDRAIDVWEAAFTEDSVQDMTVHVGSANFGVLSNANSNNIRRARFQAMKGDSTGDNGASDKKDFPNETENEFEDEYDNRPSLYGELLGYEVKDD
ncbi:MAG: hypothetical protein AAFY76_19920, partial [Cyanobacteria bacterium J06649_11]